MAQDHCQQLYRVINMNVAFRFAGKYVLYAWERGTNIEIVLWGKLYCGSERVYSQLGKCLAPN